MSCRQPRRHGHVLVELEQKFGFRNMSSITKTIDLLTNDTFRYRKEEEEKEDKEGESPKKRRIVPVWGD